MKDKAKKTTNTKDTGNKVFDVMRPGKNTVSATSRPVIVGHKPQVKDPMMAQHNDEERALLDSTQKVTIKPSSTVPDDPAENTEPHVPTAPAIPQSTAPEFDKTHELSQKPHEPTPHDEPDMPTMASVAVTGSIEKPAAGDASPSMAQTDELDEQSVADAVKAAIDAHESLNPEIPEAAKPPETPEEPMVPEDSEKHQMPDAPKPSAPAKTENDDPTVGVVFDDPAPAAPVKPPNGADPLPVLPDEPTPQAIIVAHHTPRAGAVKVFLTIFLLLIFALIVFDILLDAGFIVLDGIPHTDFF